MVTKVKGGVLDESALSGKNMTGDIAFDTTTLKIDSSNNRVGIGTASPTSPLTVSAADGTLALFTNASDADFAFKTASGVALITPSTGTLAFGTSNTERWRIDSSGHFTGVSGSKIVQTIASGGGNFLEVTHSGNEAWSLAVQSGTGADDYLDIGINGGTRGISIHEDGKIGINQTSPQAMLDLKGDTTTFDGMAKIFFTDTSGNAASRNFAIGNGGSAYGNLTFGVSNAEGGNPLSSAAYTDAMVITNAGKILINQTANSEDTRLNVAQTSQGSWTIGHTFNNRGELFRASNSTGIYYTYFIGGGSSEAGSITGANSTSVAFNTSSDYRMKENIEPIKNGLERVIQLNPVKFDWKVDGKSSEGFIAHEVSEIFADCVTGEKDGEMMQGMDYGRITPLLVKAIQEQQEQIEELKAKLESK